MTTSPPTSRSPYEDGLEHPDVVGLDWPEFLRWFAGAWRQGEHLALVAPTGAGKTTAAGGVLDLRRYVLALDAKGGDDTLEGLGYPRLNRWPGQPEMLRTIRYNDEHGLPSRYIVGPRARTSQEKARLIATLSRTLDEVQEMGGWTLYADELMIMTDPRLMNLRAQIDHILIGARNFGISLVSSYQAPRFVTPQAAQQATWVGVSYTRDVDVVNRLAEILGRPKAEIRGAIKGLSKYSWIFVGRDPHEPLRVTIPDYIAPDDSGDAA